MTTLIDDIITTLENGHSTALDEALRKAGCLFEKAQGAGARLNPAEQVHQFAWSPEVIAAIIRPQNVERLRDAIIIFLRRRPPTSGLISALWALSKLADVATKPVLIETLKYVLHEAPEALFQAMIGLANLGEDVFGGHRSMSILAVEENRKLATAYLQRQGLLYQERHSDDSGGPTTRSS